MEKIFPQKLKKGDRVMIIAPSDSLGNISEQSQGIAQKRFAEMGLELSFSDHATELNEFDSSGLESRVRDIEQAFADRSVKAVFAAFGGYNSNQILRYLDWDLIKQNPKIFVGFSDITALQNALFAKTGLVTYSGPTYSRFGQELYFEYTLEYVKKCLFQEEEFSVLPSGSWSDDWWLSNQEKRILVQNKGWLVVNEGEAKGTVLGGNLSTFNLLQGTEYFPDITDSILFLEDDEESKLVHFDRDLQSLIHLPHFDKVRGVVIGRFQNASKVRFEQLKKILTAKKELSKIPILANADFGHTDPIFTFPIGGQVQMVVSNEKSELRVIKH